MSDWIQSYFDDERCALLPAYALDTAMFIERHISGHHQWEPESWEIEPMDEMCRLTLVHDEFPSETATFKSVGGGWPLVLSSLKSLLETGEPLRMPQRSP